MSNLPKTFKAAQVVKVNEPFKINQVDWVNPGPGQIVVKVLACGICHS